MLVRPSRLVIPARQALKTKLDAKGVKLKPQAVARAAGTRIKVYAADFGSRVTVVERAEQEGLTLQDLKRFVSKVDEQLGRRAEDVSRTGRREQLVHPPQPARDLSTARRRPRFRCHNAVCLIPERRNPFADRARASLRFLGTRQRSQEHRGGVRCRSLVCFGGATCSR